MKIIFSFLLFGIFAFMVPVAQSAQPTFDLQNFTTATDQLNVLREQIEVVKETNATMENTLTAVGSAATITLPSFDDLKRQIVRGAECLLPDLEYLMPTVDFENVDIGDICRRSSVYRDTLSLDPSDLVNLSPVQRETRRNEVRTRRTAIFRDSVFSSTAAGDSGIEESTKLLDLADSLSQQADAATNLNEREAVNNKIAIAQLQATAQTNQLLAQLLRLQALYYTESGIKITNEDLGNAP